MRTTISIFISLLLLFPLNIIAAIEESEELKSYIETVIADGHKMISDDELSEEEKYKRSSKLIKDNLYLDWMARYTLGRHRKVLTRPQIEQFSETYKKFVVKAYADLSKHYDGQKAIVKNIRKIDDDMFIINMEIIGDSSNSTIKVDYLVHRFDDRNRKKYLISDIITEGISLLNSQQSEFNSIIASQGIEALISSLQTKLNQNVSSDKS